jgi:hypothetical protein
MSIDEKPADDDLPASAAYQDLAADRQRERDALAWSEGVIGDVSEPDAVG